MKRPILDVFAKSPVPQTSGQQGRWWGGGDRSTDRGTQMGAITASATLFGIVDLTSTATAKECWHLHRKVADMGSVCGFGGCDAQGVQYVERHPALMVLNKPNPFYTRQEYVATGQQHLDLTGESWTVISRVGDVPLELWNLRPDRVTVVESPSEFLLGYIYTDDEGKEWGIRKEDMLSIRKPHPKDPYRGISPVATILDQVYGTKAAAAYRNAFFNNGARPGSIVKLSRRMSDPEFDQLVERFNYNHRGVENAGRTAFLEEGDWVDVKPYTFADMQYVDSANLSRDTIMLAYRMSKFALGIIDDVNRATAEASSTWFAEQQTQPRLDMWQQMLNNDFLPQFPGYQYDLEFVYTNPVPRDREQDRLDKESAVRIYAELVDKGVDPIEAAAFAGLPPMQTREIVQAQVVKEVTAG